VGELCEIGYEELVPKFGRGLHRVLVDPIPLGLSPSMGEQAYFDPPVPECDVDTEVPPTVPDAQSAPNDVAHPPQEIPLTQNHSSKCQLDIVFSL
jgi:hypothetical protein